MQSYLCQYIFNYDTLLYFINAPLRAIRVSQNISKWLIFADHKLKGCV